MTSQDEPTAWTGSPRRTQEPPKGKARGRIRGRSKHGGHWVPLAVLAIGLMGVPAPGNAQRSLWNFESGPVRPLALSPQGDRLYVANIPDGRLEIFSIQAGGLRHQSSVAVGLEPVAVAVRNAEEVWVVNHVSDNISIVDVSSQPPRVVRTLLVGDEPRDVVFAGEHGERAFVTTARRGQNTSEPRGRADTPGLGRAQVWVFDARDLGTAPGGTPLSILTLFGDKPRALAASPDGAMVYAAIFRSGNRTTAINANAVCRGGVSAEPCEVWGEMSPGGLPAPNESYTGEPAPHTGLIVAQDPESGQWLDELGRDWSAQVRFTLPDLDVFAIDALAPVPTLDHSYSGVGTSLFNIAVNPATGAVYVSNTEARNEVRFEGPGTYASQFKPKGEPATVRGRLAESRITVIHKGVVSPRHLNKHIPYDAMPMPKGISDASLATPLQMTVTADGTTLYVAAFGSSKLGVFDVEELEADTFVPDPANHIELPGGGPSGVVLDEARSRLYTLTRFDNSVVAVDTETSRIVQRLPLHDREPETVREGRPFLYDARMTSSNGEASCSSCHLFGDLDDLAWDLGNPDGEIRENPGRGPFLPKADKPLPPFHPVKGPMRTQTLRGLANHGSQHWRGDRTGDAKTAFKQFNPAFGDLVGLDAGELSEEEMQLFTDFTLQLAPAPNPIRSLDNVLRPDEARGRDLYVDKPTFFMGTLRKCNSCHQIDPGDGRFGTLPFEFSNVPPMRDVYQLVGGPPGFGVVGKDPATAGPIHDQIRGFGVGHEGSSGSLRSEAASNALFVLTEQEGSDLFSFLLAFPTSLAPAVGQQISHAADFDSAEARIALFEGRAGTDFVLIDHPGATECELVVRGVVAGEQRGWLRNQDGSFSSDRADEPAVPRELLLAYASVPGQALTFTCAPPGAGLRMALDRDEDGSLDGDERRAGSDPANAASFPGACSDGIDNDGDGFADALDAGCGDEFGLAENPACQDGIDNDGDELFDYPQDPECKAPSSPIEFVPEPDALVLAFGAVAALLALRRHARRRGRGLRATHDAT